MLPVIQLANILPNIGPSNARVALHAHVVPQSQHNLCTKATPPKPHPQVELTDFLPSVSVKQALWLGRELAFASLVVECQLFEALQLRMWLFFQFLIEPCQQQVV